MSDKILYITEAIEFARSSIDLTDYKTREKQYLWWFGIFITDKDGVIFTPIINDCYQPFSSMTLIFFFTKHMISGLERYMNLYGYTVSIWSGCDFVEIYSDQYRILLTRNDDYDLCCYIRSLMDNLSIGTSGYLEDYLIQDINKIVQEYLGY